MTLTRTLALLTMIALASPAQALKLIIWDRELQTKLGYGETTGKGMTVQLVKDYTGPVVALFSREDEEKAAGLYASVQSRYDGFLRAGQLNLETPGGSVTLRRFLEGLKLNLLPQPAGQTLLLPGLRAATDKSKLGPDKSKAPADPATPSPQGDR
ncbi:hypothetical protein DAETH_32270 [Deinococcus aetherius]|uniref:Uncharacterized protein n=1 Tax=Deinococcus aetherius TaxID=200252 RepID=A0ABN6RIY2_9DEIO|nr:hypothetical protein [Deinococcus aetherius]BDP43258.1 hypothetical protein DAETH_32270 [Deinococcus aetherius]